MLRYKPQCGHACDFMTKCNDQAWYGLNVCKWNMHKGKKEDKFWGMTVINQYALELIPGNLMYEVIIYFLIST